MRYRNHYATEVQFEFIASCSDGESVIQVNVAWFYVGFKGVHAPFFLNNPKKNQKKSKIICSIENLYYICIYKNQKI